MKRDSGAIGADCLNMISYGLYIMTKVSVIVPVYNAEEYIEKTLFTVCNQTYKNLEILVINDGSTDNSGEIVNKLADCDSRITVLHQQNYGITYTRNIGIQAASGKYICFVDSDDWISDNFITALIEVCEIENADISFSNHAIVNNSIASFRDDYHEIIYTDPGKKNSLLCNIYFPAVHGKLYRAAFLKNSNIAFLEENGYNGFAEDILFNFQAVNHAEKIVFVDKENYFYNRDNNNSVCALSSIQTENNDDRLNVLSKIYKIAESFSYREDISPALQIISAQHIEWGGEDMARKFIKLPWLEFTRSEKKTLFEVAYKILGKKLYFRFLSLVKL